MADAFGKFLQGYSAGNQLKQQRQEEQRRMQLGELLSGARSATGAQRDGLMSQAYGVDPASAMAADQGFGQLDEAKAQRLGQMANAFGALSEQQRAQAWPTIIPQLSEIFPGVQFSPQWSEANLPMVQKLAQDLGGSGVPAGYQEFDLMTKAGGLEADDRQRAARIALGMDPRASSAAIQYKEVEGPDGRPRWVAFDPRDVGAQVVGGGQTYGSGVPSPQQGGDPFGFLAQAGAQVTSGYRSKADNERADGVPNSYHLTGQARDIVPPTDPQQAAFIRQQAQANGLEVIDEGDHWHLEPAPGAQGGANPFVGRRPEDEAAATEAAKRSVGLQFAGPEARAEADKARLVESAKAGVEKQTKQPKARLALEQAKSRVQRVDSLVDSILPRIGTTTAGWLGDKLAGIEGTPAADLRKDLGTLQAIAGFDELNAMRAASPTGGALGNVTERELAFLQSVVRNIENSQSEAQLRRNLEAFREELRGSWQRVQQAYEQDFGGQESTPANDIDGLLGKYGIR